MKLRRPSLYVEYELPVFDLEKRRKMNSEFAALISDSDDLSGPLSIVQNFICHKLDDEGFFDTAIFKGKHVRAFMIYFKHPEVLDPQIHHYYPPHVVPTTRHLTVSICPEFDMDAIQALETPQNRTIAFADRILDAITDICRNEGWETHAIDRAREKIHFELKSARQ